MYDTVLRRIVGPSRDPLVWYVGERQSEILLRRNPGKSRTLLYSAEGGGKTVLMAQWLVLQVLALMTAGTPGYGGATAPTNSRLGTLLKAVSERIPVDSPVDRRAGAWASYYSHEKELRFPGGYCIQFRATKKHSEATGSPVQGYSWHFSGDDELQDTVANGADPDIEARMRAAKVSYRMATATAKDSPGWRMFRDEKEASPDWSIERISYLETPFVWPDHWQRMQRNMSPREWQRRGLALDVGPERMVYTTWDREQNLRPIPSIGVRDVTASVLSRYGTGFDLLIGHDPGQLCDTSTILKAYQERDKDYFVWWVVDELVTQRTTTEEHVKQLLERLRNHWGCNTLDYAGRQTGGKRAHIRIDPYGDSDNRTDRSVYQTFRHYGLDAMSAAYKQGQGKGRVPKEAGIEMVCRLFCSASGRRRLFVDVDERGTPVAPVLVHAIELSERDEAGQAETQRKGPKDLSHSPASLRYALHPFERRPESILEVSDAG